LVGLVAPIDQPITATSRSIERSVTSLCWARTLSWTRISGNRGPLYGGGVLLGDDDSPFPSMFGTMMK
jgi:hypothetical protein